MSLKNERKLPSVRFAFQAEKANCWTANAFPHGSMHQGREDGKENHRWDGINQWKREDRPLLKYSQVESIPGALDIMPQYFCEMAD